MYPVKNGEIKMPLTCESKEKNIPSRMEKIFSSVEMSSRESNETHDISEGIYNCRNLKEAVGLIERENKISRKIIVKLLRKKGDIEDLNYIFNRALSINKSKCSIAYYNSLLKNTVDQGLFEFADMLLNKAEDEREVDAYFYAQVIEFAKDKKAFDFCEQAFLRFKCYFELDVYSHGCDFANLTKNMDSVYRNYVFSLIESKRWLKLGQICKELEENWQTPPYWLDQIKETLDTTLQVKLKKGQSHQKNGNHALAIEFFANAASHGAKEAMYELARCFEKGLGVPKDDFKAVEWLHNAASEGLALAQYALGVHYQKGIGVPKNEVKAFECYKKAAEWHDLRGVLALAQCYICASGTKVDLIQARDLIVKAGKNLEIKKGRLYADVYKLLKDAENSQQHEINQKRKRAASQPTPRKKPKINQNEINQSNIKTPLLACAAGDSQEEQKMQMCEDLGLNLNKSLEENKAIIDALEMLNSQNPK